MVASSDDGYEFPVIMPTPTKTPSARTSRPMECCPEGFPCGPSLFLSSPSRTPPKRYSPAFLSTGTGGFFAIATRWKSMMLMMMMTMVAVSFYLPEDFGDCSTVFFFLLACVFEPTAPLQYGPRETELVWWYVRAFANLLLRLQTSRSSRMFTSVSKRSIGSRNERTRAK